MYSLSKDIQVNHILKWVLRPHIGGVVALCCQFRTRLTNATTLSNSNSEHCWLMKMWYASLLSTVSVCSSVKGKEPVRCRGVPYQTRSQEQFQSARSLSVTKNVYLRLFIHITTHYCQHANTKNVPWGISLLANTLCPKPNTASWY